MKGDATTSCLSMASITFCEATEADAQALASLRVEAMRESLERVGRFDPIRARERFLAGFSPRHTRHILHHGEKVGFFVVKPQAEGLLLDHLYVGPRHQGLGIGAAVLTHVFAEADEAGQPVHVGALRKSASNRFYERNGFVLVEQSEFDNHYVRQATAAS
jgi:GNAT superfamily N-acetyltransferase